MFCDFNTHATAFEAPPVPSITLAPRFKAFTISAALASIASVIAPPAETYSKPSAIARSASELSISKATSRPLVLAESA